MNDVKKELGELVQKTNLPAMQKSMLRLAVTQLSDETAKKIVDALVQVLDALKRNDYEKARTILENASVPNALVDHILTAVQRESHQSE